MNALITVEDPLFPRDVPLQALRVKIDRRLGLWLLGQRRVVGAAVARARAAAPRAARRRACPRSARRDLLAHLAAARDDGRRTLVELQGPPGVGKKFVAEGLCAELGQELFVADCRAMLLGPHGVDREQLPARLAEVRREALLVGAAPYLDHYDSILVRHDPAARAPQRLGVARGAGLADVQDAARAASRSRASCRSSSSASRSATRRWPRPGDGACASTCPSRRRRSARPSGSRPSSTSHASVDANEVDWIEIGRKLALDAARIQSARARRGVGGVAARARRPADRRRAPTSSRPRATSCSTI